MSEAGLELVIPIASVSLVAVITGVVASTPVLDDSEAANLPSKQAGTVYFVTCRC